MSVPVEFERPFHRDMRLVDARDRLAVLAAEGGQDCPCCGRTSRVYRRKLTGTAAQAVAALYADYGRDYGRIANAALTHLPDQAHQGGYLTLAAHWQLITPERDGDGDHSGVWAVTALGERWLLGTTAVHAYARIYNGECLGLDGPMIGAADALGETFDLAGLIADSTVFHQDGTASLFEADLQEAA